jgi:hypothetical protein
MADWLVLGTLTVLVIFVIASFFSRRQSRYLQARYERQREAKAAFEDHLNTIFVSLPCYKDEEECAYTLFSIFNEADCPWRVTVGLLHHIDDENTPDPIDGMPTNAAAIIDDIINKYEHICTQRDATPFSSHVKTLVQPASTAKGPWAARAMIERELYGRQRFYMTVDSHTRMVKSWDTTALRLYKQCCGHHPKPILTTIPGTYLRGTEVADDDRPTFTAVHHTNANGFPVLRPIPYAEPPVRCTVAPFYAPAFSFASSNLIREVPSDPSCAFVHRGEAYVQSARYWTHGWTFLQPKEALCFHLADKSYRKTFEEQLESKDNQVLRAQGVCRALAVLRRDPCSVCGVARDEHTPSHGIGHLFSSEFPEASTVHRDGYGLGKDRTLKAFEAHCGVRVPDDVQRHARIGCCERSTVEERLSKYGRLEAYELLLNEYK